jgi:hypothetical protein
MRLLPLLLTGLTAATPAAAQTTFSQRGFLELRTTFYPQTAPNDSGRVVGEALFRWEPSLELGRGLKAFAALDARTDSHRQVERSWGLNFQDRTLLRPAFSLRRASLQWRRGPVTVEAGKQFIRWGKADILNPTDRFAPRDYLSVADNDFLGVTAARVTVEKGGNTVDAVVSPRFTPSRTPLLNQRWVVLPEELSRIRLLDEGARLPGRTQFGIRWNHLGRGYEYSAVFYEGFHHLPLFDGAPAAPDALRFRRYHPRLRMYGGDVAVPTRLVTLKAEAAWFQSSTPAADEYAIYVIQAERTWGEWSFVGGYAGEVVTERRNRLGFAPDRGFARSILARAGYTIDARRSFAAEAAARQSGDGSLVRAEYSQELSAHLRATASVTVIRGAPADFLGQFRRNSNAMVVLRYSF